MHRFTSTAPLLRSALYPRSGGASKASYLLLLLVVFDKLAARYPFSIASPIVILHSAARLKCSGLPFRFFSQPATYKRYIVRRSLRLTPLHPTPLRSLSPDVRQVLVSSVLCSISSSAPCGWGGVGVVTISIIFRGRIPGFFFGSGLVSCYFSGSQSSLVVFFAFLVLTPLSRTYRLFQGCVLNDGWKQTKRLQRSSRTPLSCRRIVLRWLLLFLLMVRLSCLQPP